MRLSLSDIAGACVSTSLAGDVGDFFQFVGFHVVSGFGAIDAIEVVIIDDGDFSKLAAGTGEDLGGGVETELAAVDGFVGGADDHGARGGHLF